MIKQLHVFAATLTLALLLVSCASRPPQRQNSPPSSLGLVILLNLFHYSHDRWPQTHQELRQFASVINRQAQTGFPEKELDRIVLREQKDGSLLVKRPGAAELIVKSTPGEPPDDIRKGLDALLGRNAPVVHVVESGEDLLRVSTKWAVNINDLRRINGLTNDTVAVGQRLVIPKPRE